MLDLKGVCGGKLQIHPFTGKFLFPPKHKLLKIFPFTSMIN
jgi:hypothetical protein